MAIITERSEGRPFFTTCHGCWLCLKEDTCGFVHPQPGSCVYARLRGPEADSAVGGGPSGRTAAKPRRWTCHRTPRHVRSYQRTPAPIDRRAPPSSSRSQRPSPLLFAGLARRRGPWLTPRETRTPPRDCHRPAPGPSEVALGTFSSSVGGRVRPHVTVPPFPEGGRPRLRATG